VLACLWKARRRDGFCRGGLAKKLALSFVAKCLLKNFTKLHFRALMPLDTSSNKSADFSRGHSRRKPVTQSFQSTVARSLERPRQWGRRPGFHPAVRALTHACVITTMNRACELQHHILFRKIVTAPALSAMGGRYVRGYFIDSALGQSAEHA
jgi:hypothetical protein